MQLQVREKGNRSVWYNTVTGEFIVSSPSCSVRRDKYDGAMALYNTWIDNDEEKESKNVSVESTNNNATIIDTNEKENKTRENITLDKIIEMVKQYVQQEITSNQDEIVNHYLDTVENEDIIEKLDDYGILDDAKEEWERDSLASTEFCSIDELIEAYDDAKEKLESVASMVSDLKDELYEYM